MASDFIDLTITSPPYDNLRKYHGYKFDFESIAKQLYRVTKPGGVVVWVVGDATIKGNETGTSFRHALYFKEIGFHLHDTMIYHFAGTGAKGSKYAYWQCFEYMFVFVKGKLRCFNPIIDHKNKVAGTKRGHVGQYSNHTRTERGIRICPEYSKRPNIWTYGGSVGDKTNHPAQFPENLAQDHILSWSHEGDIIYDPMAGAGTTGVMAHHNNRQFIMSEISMEYCKIIQERFMKRFDVQISIL